MPNLVILDHATALERYQFCLRDYNSAAEAERTAVAARITAAKAMREARLILMSIPAPSPIGFADA
jgi:hypothetical protein